MSDPSAGAARQPDFRAVFDSAPVAQLLLLPDDAVFTIVAANEAFVRVTGVSRESLVGRGIFEAPACHNIPPDLQEWCRSAIASRTPIRIPVYAFQERYWSAVATPIVGASGEVEFILYSVEEATGQMEAEQRTRVALQDLRTSEERLKFALDAGGGVGMWEWDLAADRLYADARFAELFSVDPAKAAAGAPLADYMAGIHPEDRDQVAEKIRRSIETDADYAAEYRVFPRNGSARWILAHGRCQRDAAGVPLRFPGVIFDITDRKNAEEALRQQCHLFDTALSYTPDFTYTFDLEGRFTYINRALLSLWQKPLEEAVGKDFFDLEYPAELAQRLQDQIQQVIDTSHPVKDQTPYTGAAGETGYYEYIFVPVLAADGHVEAVAGSTRDITERRKAEEALGKIEEHQALLLDLLQGQRKTSDLHEMMRAAAQTVGDYLKVDRVGFFEIGENETLDFLAGWTSSRLPLLTTAIPALWIGTRYLQEVRAGKTLAISDARTNPLTADSMFGEIGTVSLIVVPITRHGRWHAGFYVNHADVRNFSEEEIALVRDVGEQTWDAVERARAEDALRKSEEQLRIERERLAQIFEQAPVAIVVLRGRDFVIELANPSYQTLIRGRELVGRPFVEVVPELSVDVLNAFHRVLDTGQPFIANEWLITYDQDGDGVVEDHWFNLVYHPLREADNSVSGIVAVCSEVTTQVQARQELERLNRELEEFAYVSSHDLQEPLRMVNIYTQLLLRRFVGDNPEAQEYARLVQQGVTRMETLLRDLLTYSRTVHRDDTPLGTADLTVSLTEALAVLKSRIEESGAVITADPLPNARGDTAQIAHVFQNLLSNALKYRKKDVPSQVQILAQPQGEQWIISVRDNGIGFEPQYAERIFGLFKRLHKDQYPGTGLGLAICQRIVERCGGRMWAEGRPGEGATFYFALPRVDASSPENIR